jgi:outer membrane protein assembly factor BamB
LNLYVVDNNKFGILPFSAQASPSTIQNFPIPVPLHNNPGKTSVFVAGGDAIVRRFDFDGSGNPVQVCASPSLGRGAAVCPGDTLMATPSPQLYDYSSPAFQTNALDDLVYVPTYHMCSDYLRNQIIALRGSDCSIAWRFNVTGNYAMDYGAESCEVDYVRDRIYCGTHLPASHSQPTAWALQSYNGAYINNYNADSMVTRPVLRGNIVYMAAQTGSLWAFDINSGQLKWIQAVTNASITRSPWVERRVTGGFTSLILVTDTAGQLHSVTDNGDTATLNWTYTPIKNAMVNSAPTVHDKASKVYVGQNNGELHQLNLLTGVD